MPYRELGHGPRTGDAEPDVTYQFQFKTELAWQDGRPVVTRGRSPAPHRA